MCGRFVRITSIGAIKVKFNVEQVFSDLAPSYNIAPTQEIVIINDEG
jgi:putative SOS response-associated peptidase YedK